MLAIASSIPGRLRVRHPGLRAPEAAQIVTRLAALPGVETVQHNLRVGSLLVMYDENRLREEDLLAALDVPSAGRADREPEEPVALTVPPRLIAAGMAGTLGLTVYGAIVGKRRLHVTSGMLFLVAVGIHLLAGRRGPAAGEAIQRS